MQKTRNNDRGQAYAEYLVDRAKEISDEATAKAAADANDPVKRFEKSSNESSAATRAALINGTPLGEDVLPGERVNGRRVNESATVSNWQYWATQGQGKAAGFQNKDSRAVLDTWKANDLAPTAENFSSVFRLLKEFDLLPDAEPGSPDLGPLSQFGTINSEQEITEAQARQEMDAFLQAGFRKSDKNARLLLKMLGDAKLLPFAENLRAVDSYLRANNLYPETTTYSPSEAALRKFQDDRTIIVLTDPVTGQKFTEHDLSQLRSEDERRLRRIAEKGHAGNNLMDDFLEVKDLQAARDARIAAEAQREGR